MFKLATALALVGTLASVVTAEQHTVVFDNRCGFGSSGQVKFVSDGPVHEYDAFTVTNSLTNFTAFLSSGTCSVGTNPSGTGCTVVRGTLALPGQGGSSVQVAASAPFGDSFPTSFEYTGGTTPGCFSGTSSVLGTTSPFITCAANDVNLAITFC